MTHSWETAVAAAATAGALPAVDVHLADALGLVLAADVLAGSDLPPFDTSAMDGWAVAGPSPWKLGGPEAPLLAGSLGGPLAPGTAVGIATGAPLPSGAHAVLRRERGQVADGVLHGPELPAGRDVRPRGSECRAGEVVAAQGLLVRPAALGLAAAAGADTLRVIRRPGVDVFVLGDELLDSGPTRDAFVRDALGPLLPGWLSGLGAAVLGVRRLADTADALRAALAGSTADLIVTTGSTARGPVDHLHRVLVDLGAELVVDGVAVRPGHPMLLARLPGGRTLVGLPGNPLAAVSGLVTLVDPALRAMRGAGPVERPLVRLEQAVVGHPVDVRLVPVRGGHPVHHVGPAMLRGLAVADALAVIPPGGAVAGQLVTTLTLPGR